MHLYTGLLILNRQTQENAEVHVHVHVYLIEIGNVWLDNRLVPLVSLPESVLKDGNCALQTKSHSSCSDEHALTRKSCCSVH